MAINSWPIKKIDEFTKVITGGTPSTFDDGYWKDGNIPWLNSGELNQDIITKCSNYISNAGLQNSSTALMPPDTVLIALTGTTTGKTAYLTFEACANQSVSGILPSNSHNSKYLYYFLKTKRDYILKIAWGGAQKHINQNYVKNISVPLPPLAIQKQIAVILEKVDQAKQKRQEANKLTEQFLQSAFIEMFGNPIHNSNKYTVKTLNDVCVKITDGTHNSPKNDEYGAYKYITAKNIKKDGFDFTNLTYLNEHDHKKIYERCNPEYGDILYIKDGVTTGIAQMNSLNEEFSMLSSLALFKLDTRIINPFYLKEFLNNDFVYKNIRKSMGGAAITRLTIEKLKKIEILNPPLSLQLVFAELVQKVEALKVKQKESEHELANLFNSLMQKAFNGNLF